MANPTSHRIPAADGLSLRLLEWSSEGVPLLLGGSDQYRPIAGGIDVQSRNEDKDLVGGAGEQVVNLGPG